MTAEQEITMLIRSLRQLTGVGVCFYDTEQFFQYNRTGEKEYRGHYCEFCKRIRLLPGGNEACQKSDREEAMEQAKGYKKPFFFRCHMGLRELVVPVIRGKKLLGIIFLGQCRLEGENADNKIREAVQAHSGDGEEFVRLYRQLPEMKADDLIAMGDLFHLFFSRIGDEVSLFKQQGIPEDTAGRSLARRVADYIEVEYRREICSSGISKRFFVNPSYLAREFRQEMGMTVTEYIRKVRLENACRLLVSSAIPVSSIALNVGYPDAGYFTRLFCRAYGMTPTEYRKKSERAVEFGTEKA